MNREVETLQAELCDTLESAMRWLQAEQGLIVVNKMGMSNAGEDLRALKGLLNRASSLLIKIAMVGRFSSGKSFLVGGIQEKLEYLPMTDEDGIPSDQYVGLLHSASIAANACPVSIIPVQIDTDLNVGGNGFFKVRFAGDENWTDIGNSPLPAVIAAYTTDDQRAILAGRQPEHRNLTVAEVRILLGEHRVPAQLYDLPGTESLTSVHDQIALDAWADADCFIYVTQAIHALSRSDMDLLKKLIAPRTGESRQRIIFVMTGIDRAAGSNYSGRTDWQDALDANNKYLRDNFPPLEGEREAPIGPEGFIAVSPAWEAQGRWHIKEGNAALGERLIARSQMALLRKAVDELVRAGSGRKHLREVATDAEKVVGPWVRAATELLDSAQVPLERLGNERQAAGQRYENLQASISALRIELENELKQHVRRVAQSFDGLSSFLHSQLDVHVRAADLTRERDADRIDLRIIREMRVWVDKCGPATTWEAELDLFMTRTLHAVQSVIHESMAPESLLDGVQLDIDLDELQTDPSERYRSNRQDVLQKVSGIVGLSTPVATALATGVGIVGGPLLAVPGAVTLAAAILYTSMRRRKGRSTALDHLRQEWIEGLDQRATAYRDAFAIAAQAKGLAVIGRAVEILSQRQMQLTLRMAMLDSRMTDPDVTDMGGLVADLTPHCRAGSDLVENLRSLVESASPAG